MGEPPVPIGLPSRRHSYGRLSDEEAEHFDTPRPLGRAHMYKDSDREEESYSSKGYPRGETESPNSQRRGVSGTQGGHYIRPAQFQSSSSVHLGVSQRSVIRCSSPVRDYDFVPPSENLGDPISHGFYVAPAPGKSPAGYSTKATLESRDHVVIPPQPFHSASHVLAPKTLVFDSPPTYCQQPHPSPSAGSTGPALQSSGGQHASPQGASLDMMNPVPGNNYVALSPAQLTDLQLQG